MTGTNFEYIALAFAVDFILGPLQKDGFTGYPLCYLPLAVMLVAGASVRLVAIAGYRARPFSIRKL